MKRWKIFNLQNGIVIIINKQQEWTVEKEYMMNIPKTNFITYTVILLLTFGVACQPGTGPKEKEASKSGEGAQNSQPQDDRVIGVIDNQKITGQEYKDYLMDTVGPRYFQRYVEEQLVQKRSAELGVEVNEAEVQKKVDQTMQTLLETKYNGDPAVMEQSLNHNGSTMESYRKDLLRQKRRELQVSELVRKDRKINKEQLWRRFEQKYGQNGTRYRVAHILISTNVLSSNFYTKNHYESEFSEIEKEQEARCKVLRQTIIDKGSFEEIAKTESDDYTSNRGGNLGPNWKNRYGRDFDLVVDKLKVGEIGEIVKSRHGFHVVEVTEIIPGSEYRGLIALFSIGPNSPKDPRSQKQRDEEARTKAADFVNKVNAGTDFGDLARKMSDDPSSKARGGDVGVFGAKRFGPDIAAALPKLSLGTLSKPIKTARGYYVIKLSERQHNTKKDEKIARHILCGTEYSKIKQRKLALTIDEQAQKKANELLERIRAGEDFAKLAEVESEDPYTRKLGGEYPNYRQNTLGKDVQEGLSKLKPDEVGDVVKSKRGYHIIKLLEVTKEDFDKVEGIMREELDARPVSPNDLRNYLEELRGSAKIEQRF